MPCENSPNVHVVIFKSHGTCDIAQVKKKDAQIFLHDLMADSIGFIVADHVFSVTRSKRRAPKTAKKKPAAKPSNVLSMDRRRKKNE